MPRVLLGAGKQASHALNLMAWMGASTEQVVLFDDRFPGVRTGPGGRPILGRLDEGIAYCIEHSLPGFIALGSTVGAVRYALYAQAVRAGVSLTNLIHPSCIIAATVNLGSNVMIMPGCILAPSVSVGAMCTMFSRVTLEHDTWVDDNVVWGPGAVASGNVRVGRHAFVGAGVVCKPEVRIGARSLIGAGAVVVSDIPEGVIAMGVPARVHGKVSPGLDAPTLEELQELGL
jgi:sugar O-acyltransferase (sialic acid O-acetyltransferase NeuD family)